MFARTYTFETGRQHCQFLANMLYFHIHSGIREVLETVLPMGRKRMNRHKRPIKTAVRSPCEAIGWRVCVLAVIFHLSKRKKGGLRLQATAFTDNRLLPERAVTPV